MKTNRLVILCNVGLAMASCSETADLKLLNGQYSGSFYYRAPNMPAAEKSTNEVTLQMNQGNTYNTSGHPDRKPAGGSGDFTILKNNMVNFTDKNVWTADFDWKLILNGRFVYEIKGDSLILTRYEEPCPYCSTFPSLYQYRLRRLD